MTCLWLRAWHVSGVILGGVSAPAVSVECLVLFVKKSVLRIQKVGRRLGIALTVP